MGRSHPTTAAHGVGALLHTGLVVGLAGADGTIAAAEVFVGACWALMGLAEHRLRGTRVTTRADASVHWLAGGWLALAVLGLTGDGAPSWWGAPVVVSGLALRLTAIRQLAGAYEDDLAPRRLERGGPYGWLDHPGEVGALCVAVGSAVVLGVPWAFVPVVAVIGPVTFWRARAEERLLASAFG